MIDEKLLEILRCPIDPRREAKLVMDDTRLICSRCRVQFRNREGFYGFIPEEAVLPDGCPKIENLPCQASSSS